MTSGLEGAWTSHADALVHSLPGQSVPLRMEAGQEPRRRDLQWIPTDEAPASLVPDAHVEGKRNAPIMFTTDLALKEDPGSSARSRRALLEKPESVR